MLSPAKHVVSSGNREGGCSHALVKAPVDLDRYQFLPETINLPSHLPNLSLQLLNIVLFLLHYLSHELNRLLRHMILALRVFVE